jgi:hypothetical protein
LLEICFNFKRAFYDKGVLITNSEKIIINYLKGYFFWDLAISAVYIIGYFSELDYLELFMLLRTGDLMKFYVDVEEKYRLKEKLGNNISDLIKLISTIILLAHYIACSWHFAAHLGLQLDKSETTWLGDNINAEWNV